MNPAKPAKAPTYRLHKPSGRAVVTLDGRDHYLGIHGTTASINAYNRLVSEWQAHGGRLPDPAGEPGALTIAMLVVRFMDHANLWYVKAGRKTGEVHALKSALRPLTKLYADLMATEFGPKKLATVRDEMIRLGWCRRTCNASTHRIRRMFRWAAAEELVPADVLHALTALPPLLRGRCNAPDREPIRPVDDAIVDAIQDHVAPNVWDMIQVQRLTGMRPAEVCVMRTADIDTTGALWEFRPAHHKTEHHGAERVIPLGPRARAIVQGYLRPVTTEYLFQPADAIRWHAGQAKTHRRPSQKATPRKTERTLAEHFTTDTYRKAIALGCRKAGTPTWKPNQLRHSAATRIRKELGLEAAQVVLGHSSADVTQIYAERNLGLAREIATKLG